MSNFLLRLLLLSSLFLCLCLPIFAQNTEWRLITPAELQADKPIVESDAGAEAFFWEEKIEQGLGGTSTEVYVRAKIFNTRGIDTLSVIKVQYDDPVLISNFRVRIVQPDSGIIELTEKDVISAETVRTAYTASRTKTYVLPHLKIGSIVEYKYRSSVNSGEIQRNLVLQKPLPVRDLRYYVKGSWFGKTLKIMRFNVTDYEYRKIEDGYTLISVKNTRAVSDEPNLPPLANLVPFLFLYSDSTDETDPEKYWKKYAKNYYFLAGRLNKSGPVKKLAAEITAGLSTPEEKAAAIFNYCHTKIDNINFNPDIKKEDIEKAYKNPFDPEETIKKRSGHDSAIRDLFATLAAAAGLEVRYVITGDRRKFFFQKVYPAGGMVSIAGVAVKTSNGWYFCEPADKFVPGGYLRSSAEGQDALLIGEKDQVWATVPISGPALNRKVKSARFLVKTDGSIEGTVKITLYGLPGASFKGFNFKRRAGDMENDLRNELKDTFTEFYLSDLTVKNVGSPTDPVEIAYRIKVPGYSQLAGTRMFFKPGFFSADSRPVFNALERRSPIYFEFLMSELDDIEFELPAGYDLETRLAPQQFGGGEAPARYRSAAAYDPATRILRFQRVLAIGENGRLLYPAASYPVIKDVFDRISQADSTIISLKKN